MSHKLYKPQATLLVASPHPPLTTTRSPLCTNAANEAEVLAQDFGFWFLVFGFGFVRVYFWVHRAEIGRPAGSGHVSYESFSYAHAAVAITCATFATDKKENRCI